MNTFKIAAAIAAATFSALAIAPAFAQSDEISSAQGHYEWHHAPQYGPRAMPQASTRVWVPNASQVASCDCSMMKMSSAEAADCMKNMHGAMTSAGHSAG